MPCTLVHLTISNHLQGSENTPGPLLGSNLTQGTLLHDYFKEPLVRLKALKGILTYFEAFFGHFGPIFRPLRSFWACSEVFLGILGLFEAL